MAVGGETKSVYWKRRVTEGEGNNWQMDRVVAGEGVRIREAKRSCHCLWLACLSVCVWLFDWTPRGISREKHKQQQMLKGCFSKMEKAGTVAKVFYFSMFYIFLAESLHSCSKFDFPLIYCICIYSNDVVASWVMLAHPSHLFCT